MPFSFFIQMTITAIITVWSPGPNNIMLLSTASRYGIRKNLRFMAGIWTGSLTLMILSGLLCSTLAAVVPGIQPVMKWVGALYLLYLAWGTWNRRPPQEGTAEREPSYGMGFFLQMVNVKIIIYGLTMFSSFILPHVQAPPVLLLFAVYLMILGALGNLIWACAGNVLKRFYEKHYRLMNGVMALLVVWCALRIVGIL
ncbi:MAG: LysE family transporter [Eubacteriales bacterium]|nr:LysE family transporter [Eubacteriales bacterium]